MLPWCNENREFGSLIFQIGKTRGICRKQLKICFIAEGIYFQHRDNFNVLKTRNIPRLSQGVVITFGLLQQILCWEYRFNGMTLFHHGSIALVIVVQRGLIMIVLECWYRKNTDAHNREMQEILSLSECGNFVVIFTYISIKLKRLIWISIILTTICIPC